MEKTLFIIASLYVLYVVYKYLVKADGYLEDVVIHVAEKIDNVNAKFTDEFQIRNLDHVLFDIISIIIMTLTQFLR